MISVSNLGKAFGAQKLFAGVSFQFNPGNCYGLVGANGSGKTTFLNILAGDEPPSEGTISIPKRLEIGVLKQDHFRYEEREILDVVMMGSHQLWQAMTEKEALLAHADREFDAERYAELEELILHCDGYSLEARSGEILEGLGIPTEIHRQRLASNLPESRFRHLQSRSIPARVRRRLSGATYDYTSRRQASDSEESG